MKKVCVFGATGQTGIEVLKELIARNYEINAFVRNPDKIKFGQVKIFTGNIFNLEDVEKSIEGCDAIISVLGHTKNTDPEMQTKAITNIVDAMEKQGIKRIISLTGTGVRQSGDKISLVDRLANYLINKIDPNRISDGIKHAEKLQTTFLNWTIVRVLKLINSKQKLSYKLTMGGPAEIFTSRPKVARVIVDLLETNEFNQKMPVVSK